MHTVHVYKLFLTGSKINILQWFDLSVFIISHFQLYCDNQTGEENMNSYCELVGKNLTFGRCWYWGMSAVKDLMLEIRYLNHLAT